MKKYTLLKKAYQIDFSKIEEGFLYDSHSFIVYSETRNKAKSALLKKAYCESICLYDTPNDEVNYLTIPVIRCKVADKFDFEGSEMNIQEIEETLSNRKRDKELIDILNNDKLTHCYIIKGAYYRPNSRGYTNKKHEAGIYTKKDAVSRAKSCREIDLEVIDTESHNKMIDEAVSNLMSQVIELKQRMF